MAFTTAHQILYIYNAIVLICVFLTILIAYHHLNKFWEEFEHFKKFDDNIGKLSYSVLIIALCIIIDIILIKSPILVITILGTIL